MKTLEKNISLHAPHHEEREVKQVVSFRAKPSQVKLWNEESKKLGIKDFSAFIRGAVQSAIYLSKRSKDPKWQEFIEAVQPTAKRILGYGFYDGGAADFESSGTEHKGIPAAEVIKRLKGKHGIK